MNTDVMDNISSFNIMSFNIAHRDRLLTLVSNIEKDIIKWKKTYDETDDTTGKGFKEETLKMIEMSEKHMKSFLEEIDSLNKSIENFKVK